MKLRYNAPVTLTFSLIAVLVLVIDMVTLGASNKAFFMVYGTMNPGDPIAWIRLFSHAIGHGSWSHLIGNLSFLLLLGPILEEKYGSLAILLMMFLTALATGILNVLLFSTSLLGASGIVFMFILLASFTNIKAGEIPLTFILVVAIYLAGEILNSFKNDSVSQFAHLLGGIFGSLFGFFLPSRTGK